MSGIVVTCCDRPRARAIAADLERGAVVLGVSEEVRIMPEPRRKFRRIGGSDRLWRALRGGR